MKRFSFKMLLVAAVAVGLSGCGGDDNPNNNGSWDGSHDYIELGGLKWMKKNLNEQTANSLCYENKSANCTKYGRLYTWEASKTACQSIGWRLPSREEWEALLTAADGEYNITSGGIAGGKLKSKSGWYDNDNGGNGNGNGTDDFGFSALPGGGVNDDGLFYHAGYIGHWWTATESGGGYAYRWSMYYVGDYVFVDDQVKSFGLSVRCVKD
ncbi:MAG: hypothetical protein LBC59_09705 [Chitinispirillales bacterium]|jgi:uncharacterized protein (TIGR02145 family)|nr:hypothetical protein [Chitinispirillales bacterium]